MKTLRKNKHCPKCKLDLPIKAFTSTRAKFCLQCHRLRKFEQQQASRQRQIDKLKTKKQKTKGIIRISDLKKKVQRVFNKWIRTRDAGQPCLACGKHSDKMDASHFFAMGSTGALRYNEKNVHSTCVSCNRFKHGNLLEFRINLVKKIGSKQVGALEAFRNNTHKFTRTELNELLEKYQTKKES